MRLHRTMSMSLSCILLSSVAVPISALAQTPQAATVDPEAAIEDIVVTARRRAESLQDTPIAISAFSGSDIARRSSDGVAAIVQDAPNVTFDTTAPISGSSNAVSVFIRGVGQTDFAVATDPGVGIYLDGVYIARSTGGVLDLVDIDRIEVLRGPQGTLFGKNTIGGAVSVTTKKPDFNELSGQGDVTFGRYNRLDFRGGINLPIADTLAVRVSGARRTRDGYGVRLPAGDSLGGIDNYTVRGALRWEASPSLEINLSSDYTSGDEDSPVLALRSGSQISGIGGIGTTFAGLLYNNLITGPGGLAPCQTPGFPIPFCGVPGLIGLPTLPAGTVPYDRRWLSPDLFTSFGTGPTGSSYEIFGVNGTIEWDVAGAKLKSISAYRQIRSAFGRDSDGSPIQIIETSNRVRQHQFSQELQLSGKAFDNRLDWLLGGYYFDEHASDFVTVPFSGTTFDTLARLGLGCTLFPALTGAPVPIAVPVCPNVFRADSLNDGVLVDNTSYAAFGEATYNLTSSVSLTAGLRWSQDRKAIDLRDVLAGGLPVAALDPRDARTFEEVTPRFILDWKPAPGTLIYASYSQGYKSGGFNQRYGAPIGRATDYDSEKVTSIELGAKLDLLSRRLRLNGALFGSNYNNIQVVVFDGGIPRTINAAKGRIYGAEFEATAIPLRGLTLELAYGYLNTGYRALDAAIIGSFGAPIVNPLSINNRFVNSPEHVVTISAEYMQELGSKGSLRLRGDVSYRSETFNDAINTIELRQGPIAIVNARLTYTLPGDNFSLSVFGTNLTDRQYITSGVADERAFGLVEVNAARRREWGITAGFKF